jgi:hypothetical protein
LPPATFVPVGQVPPQKPGSLPAASESAPQLQLEPKFTQNERNADCGALLPSSGSGTLNSNPPETLQAPDVKHEFELEPGG